MPSIQPSLDPTTGQPSGEDDSHAAETCAPVVSAPVLPSMKPSDPVRIVIQSALLGAAARVEANDTKARTGDVEGVHRLRTTTRRLRGELRAFRHLVNSSWRREIEADLKWLAGALGGVRDLDVLKARLESAATRLQREESDDSTKSDAIPTLDALEPLFDELRRRHHAATEVLRQALRSTRYAKLVENIIHSAGSLEGLLEEGTEESCRKVLPALALEAWTQLKRDGRELELDSPDENFHEVRKRSKRARYTAELIAPVLGDKLENKIKRFIALTTDVQDVLGEHQDAIIACQEIRRVRALHSSTPTLVHAATLLLRDQMDAAQSARESFFPIWNRLDRKKRVRWMRDR